ILVYPPVLDLSLPVAAVDGGGRRSSPTPEAALEAPEGGSGGAHTRALEGGDAHPPDAGVPSSDGLEVLRFLRNRPGSVVPIELSTFRLHATAWDLTSGPTDTIRSVELFAALGET